MKIKDVCWLFEIGTQRQQEKTSQYVFWLKAGRWFRQYLTMASLRHD